MGREELFTRLQNTIGDLNLRCDQIAAEVRGVEDRLTEMGVGVNARVDAGDDGSFGYRRVGSRWRIVKFGESPEYRPLSDLSREEKLVAHRHLDAVLQAIVDAASSLTKEGV